MDLTQDSTAPTSTITTMAAQIVELAALVATLQADLTTTKAMVNVLLNPLAPVPYHPPPLPPPPPTPAAGPPAPTRKPPSQPPNKKTFAAAAASGPPLPAWQPVPQKTKASKKAPLFVADNTKVDCEVVFELASPIPTTLSYDTILLTANQALSSTGIKMVLVRRTHQSNLVFTSPNTPASLVEPYFETLAFTLRPLQLDPSSIRINSRWSQFIIHNIPTSLEDDLATGQAVASTITEGYVQITLCPIPHWLTTADKRTMKESSSMVLSFPGS